MAATTGSITEVRGRGLMVAAQLRTPIAAEVAASGLARGLVLNNIGTDIMRFLPPLVCEQREIDTLLESLATILDEGSPPVGNGLKGRDLLSLADLSPAEVRLVLDTAHAQKAAWAEGKRDTPLAGMAVALVFEKPSVRTLVSFEVACARLGATPVVLSGSDSAFSRGETVADTARVLERYCEAIALRTFAHSKVAEVAEVASVPVINSLSDDFHPCQGLADLLTIEEHLGGLEGRTLAYVGDGNNMAHTYLQAAALTGMHVRIATPPGYEASAEIIEQARGMAPQTGATILVTTDPHEAVADADVIAADTWASMGQESERAPRFEAFAPFRVNTDLMARADKDAIFMHCLPAHRGEEVTEEVIEAPYSVVFDEAENRLHAQKALLTLLLA
jgi:ornithine carbamoyltransferase